MVKQLMDFEVGPQRPTAYYCKECERGTVAGQWAPGECDHCECTEFWSEFDLGAPCNRQEEEENDEDEETQLEFFFDGEETFQLKRVA